MALTGFAILVAAFGVGMYTLEGRGSSPRVVFGLGAEVRRGISIPVDLPPQELRIETVPSEARLTITLQDTSTLSGVSPFAELVPGGLIEISVSKPGYKSVTRQVTLDEPGELKIWLDPEGLLHESLVRFKCGRQPSKWSSAPMVRNCGSACWEAMVSKSTIRSPERSSVMCPWAGRKPWN